MSLAWCIDTYRGFGGHSTNMGHSVGLYVNMTGHALIPFILAADSEIRLISKYMDLEDGI